MTAQIKTAGCKKNGVLRFLFAYRRSAAEARRTNLIFQTISMRFDEGRYLLDIG